MFLIDGTKMVVVRYRELALFVQNILVPENIAYRIVWISGIGGIGKSVLLEQLREKCSEKAFCDYCLTAFTDERQSTPINIMASFAEQLRKAGHSLTKFENALASCREDAQRLQQEQQALLAKLPDTTSSIAGILPIIGNILQMIAKPVTESLIFVGKRYLIRRVQNSKRLEDPIGFLTRVFIEDLGRLTRTKPQDKSSHIARPWRVILFFDTFEKLSPTIVPWLLNHFLERVNNNIVLVVAGRDPYDYSTENAPKQWSRYSDSLFSISLN